MFPKKIENVVHNLNFKIDNVGRSNDCVYIFENKYVLKVSNNVELLDREKRIFDFLSQKNIPGSKSICYVVEENIGYYLRTFIEGDSLISCRLLNDPNSLIDILVNVIKILRSLDESDCPIKSQDNIGDNFVHGDLCLPNIFVNEKNEFIGFIDVGNGGKGDEWYDYAWLLWSLEYNLNTTKYNNLLLEKIGVKFDNNKFCEYIPIEYRQK